MDRSSRTCAIVKVLPKIELIQKRVFLPNPPTANITALIGCVNATDVTSLFQTNSGQAANTFMLFPAGTLLLLGLPAIRKFRFDGVYVCEVGMKFAANLYQDNIAVVSGGGLANGGNGYVTWNRLFHPNLGYWSKVKIGSNDTLIYPEADFNLLANVR